MTCKLRMYSVTSSTVEFDCLFEAKGAVLTLRKIVTSKCNQITNFIVKMFPL